jgi:hypothetical protein
VEAPKKPILISEDDAIACWILCDYIRWCDFANGEICENQDAPPF